MVEKGCELGAETKVSQGEPTRKDSELKEICMKGRRNGKNVHILRQCQKRKHQDPPSKGTETGSKGYRMWDVQTTRLSWGPFLKSPGNFSGLELYLKIKIYGMVLQLLARKPARLLSST